MVSLFSVIFGYINSSISLVGYYMSKTLVAHEQPLNKVFSDDYVFQIPGYQRPYAWTTEQALELFDDLTGFMQANSGPVEDMPPYFLGSIVIIKGESPTADVVDGQQRLTTLTILLAAIRSCVSPKSAGEITPLLYEKGSAIRGTKDRFRLTLRERDKEFFQKYVQKEDGFKELSALAEKLPESQTKIRENAKQFENRLNDLTEIEQLRLAQFIVTKCYLVIVATPDLDSAYRIFSVLNSRGLDLSATDILKAEIIGAISEGQRKAYTQKWEDKEEELGRDEFNSLFSHIRMVYRKAKPQGTLLREFRVHVDDLKLPTHFVDNVLLPMSKAYEDIRDAAFETTLYADQINEHLRWLNRLEFTDWLPPALAFVTRYRNKSEYILKFFCDLERLAYSMLLIKSGVNERMERFSTLTGEIEKPDFGAWTEESILQLTPKEQEMVYSRLNGRIYEELAARARTTLLLRLDALLSGGSASYNYATISVEHILPQTPKSDSLWLQWFSDSNEHDYWVHRLGNLALLSRNKNSSASNYEFNIKKQTYFTKNGVSPFALTTQVLSESEWTPQIVNERQQKLLQVLKNHWRLQV